MSRSRSNSTDNTLSDEGIEDVRPQINTQAKREYRAQAHAKKSASSSASTSSSSFSAVQTKYREQEALVEKLFKQKNQLDEFHQLDEQAAKLEQKALQMQQAQYQRKLEKEKSTVEDMAANLEKIQKQSDQTLQENEWLITSTTETTLEQLNDAFSDAIRLIERYNSKSQLNPLYPLAKWFQCATSHKEKPFSEDLYGIDAPSSSSTHSFFATTNNANFGPNSEAIRASLAHTFEICLGMIAIGSDLSDLTNCMRQNVALYSDAESDRILGQFRKLTRALTLKFPPLEDNEQQQQNRHSQ